MDTYAPMHTGRTTETHLGYHNTCTPVSHLTPTKKLVSLLWTPMHLRIHREENSNTRGTPQATSTTDLKPSLKLVSPKCLHTALDIPVPHQPRGHQCFETTKFTIDSSNCRFNTSHRNQHTGCMSHLTCFYSSSGNKEILDALPRGHVCN